MSAPGFIERVARWLRHFEPARLVYRFGTRFVLPTLVFLAVSYAVLGVGYRLLFHEALARQGLCSRSESSRVEGKFDQGFAFDTRMTCLDTGLDLVAGRSYTVRITPGEPWIDFTQPASYRGLSGWSTPFHWEFLLALPMRRHVSMPWFALTGEIGLDSGQIFPLRLGEFTFRASEGGRLFLYVNDAINALSLPVPSEPDKGIEPICPYVHDESGKSATSTAWCGFYTNNRGTASVVVTQL